MVTNDSGAARHLARRPCSVTWGGTHAQVCLMLMHREEEHAKNIYIYIFLNPHLRAYLLILERGDGTERERGGEKYQSIASHMPPIWGLNLQPRQVP